MDILMVTPVLPNALAASGGAIVMHGQLMALADRHRVTLATFRWGDPTDGEAVGALETAGVRVHAIARAWPGAAALARPWLMSQRPLRAIRFTDGGMQRLLDRLMRQRFDLIHVEDTAMAQYRYASAARTILTDHDVRVSPPPEVAPAWLRGPLARAFTTVEAGRWRRYQPVVWRRFDAVQVFTERDAAAVEQLAPDVASRVSVNPFGVDAPPAPPLEAEEPGSVLFVGGFMHTPNVDAAQWLATAIMPRLRELAPSARLTIVGSHAPDSIRGLACEDVIVAGDVPTVEPYLQRAAVVVAPLRLGGGMRVKVLQALALGKAVVSTTLGAEGLAVGAEAPPLALADDADTFARATVALLHDTPMRRQLGRQARAFVENHRTWRAYGRRLDMLHARLGLGQSTVMLERS